MDNRQLIMKMTEYYAGRPGQIQHFMKVYAYARLIGEMEHLSGTEQDILEVAAIVHDIGIKVSEEKYGDSIGPHQEKEGPEVAEKMLTELGYDETVIQRVSYLVGHHHTYHNIDGLDYQILVEADFLVNLFEHGVSEKAVKTALGRMFKTNAGKALCSAMFAV